MQSDSINPAQSLMSKMRKTCVSLEKFYGIGRYERF